VDALVDRLEESRSAAGALNPRWAGQRRDRFLAVLQRRPVVLLGGAMKART